MSLIKDFPFFEHNKGLIYLDNAATTQKPQAVIDAVNAFYTQYNAPVHRGIYAVAERATTAYEEARAAVAQFIGAQPDEIIFTKGTTEAINLVAAGWAAVHLKPGDEIIISELEHHANILPWMRLERTHGIILKYIPINTDGTLNYEAYLSLLTEKTKLVSCTHTSNVLGTQVDLDLIIRHARAVGARVLIDAAQAVMRVPLRVDDLKADFVAFSSHKMLGPTGIGVLYMAQHMQAEVEPYQVGGGMVYSVDFHDAVWGKPPLRYEAGTPPIAQAIGLAAAVRYIEEHISFEQLSRHEAALTAQLIDALESMPSIKLLGPIDELRKSGHMVSFTSSQIHPHDIAAYLGGEGICVRAGHHCAQPLHTLLGTEGSVRVSFAPYNSASEVQRLIESLHRLQS